MKNIGTCKQLKDKPYFCFIFMDDNESSWTPSEINQIWFDQIKEAIYFIHLNANYYKVDLDIQKGIYSSCEENRKIHYHGNVNPDLYSKDVEDDILDQIASSLGFKSKNKMHNYIKNQVNRDQIAYIILFNKKGVSYAYLLGDTQYCVIFNGYLNTNSNCSSTTIVHEILHLFGAIDYYDPFGKFPNRKKIAETYYTNDIMLVHNRNIYLNTIGQYTAYSIGWLKDCPSVCNCKDWWS